MSYDGALHIYETVEVAHAERAIRGAGLTPWPRLTKRAQLKHCALFAARSPGACTTLELDVVVSEHRRPR